MKIIASSILFILIFTSLRASDRDVRVDVIRQLISELDPELYPRIAIVKEACSVSKTFSRFTREELSTIIDGSRFRSNHLIPVGNVEFPDREDPEYHDSQSGLGLFLISITRITLRNDGLYVDYMIDSGIRVSGFNHPSDGNYEVGSFKITNDEGSRYLEHVKITELNHQEARSTIGGG